MAHTTDTARSSSRRSTAPGRSSLSPRPRPTRYPGHMSSQRTEARFRRDSPDGVQRPPSPGAPARRHLDGHPDAVQPLRERPRGGAAAPGRGAQGQGGRHGRSRWKPLHGGLGQDGADHDARPSREIGTRSCAAGSWPTSPRPRTPTESSSPS